MKKILAVLAILLLLAGVAAGYKLYRTEAYLWLPDYLSQAIPQSLGMGEKPNPQEPIDIMFIFVDHFEPTTDAGMGNWVQKYPESVAAHFDADGRHPQHVWFFARENLKWLKELSALAYDGYGEVEFHLHHANDTAKTLTDKIEHIKNLYAQTGALITAEEKPKQVYGFIHGMWALDNSRAGCCGVNNELVVLKNTGCYADFTFPSHHQTQPSLADRIYYAVDDPDKPKSYGRGIIDRVHVQNRGDLMIFAGPLLMRLQPLPRIENSSIEAYAHPSAARAKSWVNANIHVRNQPNWIFIKVHTHGADPQNAALILGKPMQEVYTYLEKNYNDGKRYRLHYVTTREAYNIVRAAEDGLQGNPSDYRDYILKPYANDEIKTDNLYRLRSYGKDMVSLERLDTTPAEFTFKNLVLKRIKGDFTQLHLTADKQILLRGLPAKNIIHIEIAAHDLQINNGTVLSLAVLNGILYTKLQADAPEVTITFE